MQIKFYKYHGAGNDFILIDARESAFPADSETIASLCHRRFGIGADGLMMLETDPASEFYMRYFNADGGESTMCGNGGRCIALFAHHLGIGGRVKTFNSIDGMHSVEILSESGAVAEVRLQMIDVDNVSLSGDGYFLNTGSPHYVEFTDDVEDVDVFGLGREVRYSEAFEQSGGTNVNFVQFNAPGDISMRTYERGVEDETWACGTGATASAIVASVVAGDSTTDFTVRVLGGMLRVTFEGDPGSGYRNVYLTGPAERVFEGMVEI